MAKFFGEIGFSSTVETSPGVWEDTIIPREYYGDVVREGRRWEKGESINDNLIVNNYISVLADTFAYENYQYMKWVSFMNAKWKIASVEIEYPRIKLTLGGVWNGS